LSIVIQKTRQLRMQNTATGFVKRWAVLSLDSSALQPDFRILWNTSIFHLKVYHSSFSMASVRDATARSHRQRQTAATENALALSDKIARLGGQIITRPERRRRWSEEEKLQLVEVACRPGNSVSQVARLRGHQREPAVRLVPPGVAKGIITDRRSEPGPVPR
jgi:hypothetical protein